MAKESSMLPLGTKATPFKLIDTISNSLVSLDNFSNKKLCVIMFICNHCPYVKHIQTELVQLAQDYLKEVAFIAINSNDVESYPEDSPEKMKETALSLHFPFPYLFDETQEVAKSYQATCTPDFFIYDKRRILAYRGQFDNSRPGNSIKVTGDSLRQALDGLLSNHPVDEKLQKASIGCGIKWK